MAYTQVLVGAVANDNTGDPIRDAFIKVNNVLDALDLNFAVSSTIVIGDDPDNIGTPAGFENTISSAVVDGDIVITPNGAGKVILSGSAATLLTVLTTPLANGAAGDTLGDFKVDAGNLYVCVEDFGGTDIWRRVVTSTF